MDRLWAPWRMAYILGAAEPSDACIFCSFPAQGPEHFEEHQILLCTARAFVIMNRFPYNNGHIMVVPRAHAADPGALSGEDYSETCELLRRSASLLQREMGAHGLNIGMNLGRVSGAGIDQHCHFHVVPRWSGDTNFMPVIGDVKVLGETVLATYERLKGPFQGLAAELQKE